MTRFDKDIVILIDYYSSLRREYERLVSQDELTFEKRLLGMYHIEQIEKICEKILDLRSGK